MKLFLKPKVKIKIIKIERNMNYLKKIRKIYKIKKNVVSKDIYYPNMKIDKVLNEGNSKLILDIKKTISIKFNYLDRGLIDIR